jgi:RNA polymerase sigma factor FliA
MEAPAEEHALWVRWRDARDRSAHARLIDFHLSFADDVAAAYFGRQDDIEREEFVQFAVLGMVEAMERFEPSLGVGFRKFASLRMHGAITDGIESVTERQQQAAAVQRLMARRREAPGEADSPTEAERTNLQVAQYASDWGLAVALAWLFEGSGLVHTGDRAEAFPFYRHAELKQIRQRIHDVVDALPEQERTVIQAHYLNDQPFEQVATRLRLSRGRISQIHRRALQHLRASLRDMDVGDALA